MDHCLEEIKKQERVPVLKASMDVTKSSKLPKELRLIALDSGLLIYFRTKNVKRPHKVMV